MKTTFHFAFFFLLMLVSLFSTGSLAQTREQGLGQAVSVQGRVEVRHLDQQKWETVRLHDSFKAGDIIRVAEGGRADIRLSGDTVIRVDQNTSLTFRPPEQRGLSLVDLIKGAFYFLSNRPQRLKFGTPFVNGTVEGTEFYVRVEADQTLVTMFKGRLLLANQTGRLLVSDQQSALAQAGQAPRFQTVIRPRDAVAWTLYYLPVLECEKAQTVIATDPLLSKVCSASALLAIGRADEAIPLLEQVLAQTPAHPSALALRSVVALAQNEADRALKLSAEAIRLGAGSPSAWLAHSYALQSRFDLDGARGAVSQAVRLQPGSALVLTRLAELELSAGRLDEAVRTAQEAAALDPGLSRAQSIFGFAHLGNLDTDRAKKAFEKALILDQTDPLPRLGTGLALMREGKVDEGRIQLEIAASLDPQNSLIRSYLGKAYYDEKRDKHAAEQFELAKRLDPNDPTPFLYDAIRKQTVNRPVEAIRDLEHSIRLNDNRGVYRSRLLLDEDLAARGINIARIYTDLGFEQRALFEGWKSVSLDPANYSAHRFLSDSYSALPRHEVARVSELLQSQLLQPMNILPVQPHLAEAQTFFLQGTGVTDSSFNEYAPLFNRNRLGLLVSGMAGERHTVSNEIVQSGVLGRWSYSIGQFHYETDGFRANNDLTTDIYNLFAQVRLTPKTSLQTELRWSEKQYGDRSVSFFPNDFLPKERQEDERRSARIGFHHSFAPGSDLIGTAMYGKFKNRLDDISVIDSGSGAQVAVDSGGHDESYNTEIQHIWRVRNFSLITGGGYVSIDQRQTLKTSLIIPIPYGPPMVIPLDSSDPKTTMEHTNFYLYSHINYPENVILTLGSSYDHQRGELRDVDRVNPKFGLTWSILPSTTLRAAVFKTVKRTLVADQTIEPTQVAGFNQFFDDLNGTAAWRYGVGLDQKFSRDLYGGVEQSWRVLEVPYILADTTGTSVRTADWRERLTRAYLYWTPHRWIAATAEYLYEDFDHSRKTFGTVEEVQTHRFPLGLSFFHPSGFTARARATYVNQKGKFRPQGLLNLDDPSIRGNGSFWVVDGEVSYRLPERYGLITLGAKNLFDKSFRYQDVDPINPKWLPRRFAYFKFTLSF